MQLDRDTFLIHLGGEDAVKSLDSEAKADALEDFLAEGLEKTVAEIEDEIPTRNFRRGAGTLFAGPERMKKLPPLPSNPTLADFFRLRFGHFSQHVLQSAGLTQRNGMSDEVVLACLLHDLAQAMIRTDHGWWAAQLFEPYVPEKTSFAIRHHQTLRFYPDEAHGYKYPELYRQMFGVDYVPPPHIEANYKWLRDHPWYIYPRQVTVNDLYAFDPNVKVSLDQFTDLLGRHFKQPKEGLGNDNSPVAHMWRSIARPDSPL